MRITLRVASFVIGMCILLWCLSHAGGFNPDGSPVDPNPPPFYLIVAGTIAAPLLWLYALGAFQVLSRPLRSVGDAETRQAEHHGPESMVGPASNGESAPPTE
ncbi:MAG: hypothetical protein JJ992_24230 [Planctomycetes bacterium]|nr:hypothetical protein [Planctomycetota bacterium]